VATLTRIVKDIDDELTALVGTRAERPTTEA
jgi:hypothetical protein